MIGGFGFVDRAAAFVASILVLFTRKAPHQALMEKPCEVATETV